MIAIPGQRYFDEANGDADLRPDDQWTWDQHSFGVLGVAWDVHIHRSILMARFTLSSVYA